MAILIDNATRTRLQVSGTRVRLTGDKAQPERFFTRGDDDASDPRREVRCLTSYHVMSLAEHCLSQIHDNISQIKEATVKEREFNRHMRACRKKDKNMVDPDKIAALPEEVRTAMVHFLLRCQRAPILVQLLTPQVDRQMLGTCGYWRTTTGAVSGLTFLHTDEWLYMHGIQ